MSLSCGILTRLNVDRFQTYDEIVFVSDLIFVTVVVSSTEIY